MGMDGSAHIFYGTEIQNPYNVLDDMDDPYSCMENGITVIATGEGVVPTRWFAYDSVSSINRTKWDDSYLAALPLSPENEVDARIFAFLDKYNFKIVDELEFYFKWIVLWKWS